MWFTAFFFANQNKTQAALPVNSGVMTGRDILCFQLYYETVTMQEGLDTVAYADHISL